MSDRYDEKLRPQFHFTTQAGWLNDPNGMVFFRGEYHLFFQHNPFGVEWGNMTWGHAVSRDLLHWTQLPHAIEPDELGTIFSGSAVVDHHNTAGFGAGAMVCLYTAAGGTSDASKGQPFTQCLAWSTDGRTFTKFAGNPVLGERASGNRDPKVIWHAPTARWVMALYLDKSDFALLASPDLKAWTTLQTITIEGCTECPDFFPLQIDGDADRVKWVFTVADGRYLTGDFDGERFVPDDASPRALASGPFYAVQTFSDSPDERRIQIAWLRQIKYPEMPFSQQMGVPVELTLRTDDAGGVRLRAVPIAELKSLRAWERTWRGVALAPGESCALSLSPSETAAGYDIGLAFAPGSAERIELSVLGFSLNWDRATQLLNGQSPLRVHAGTLRFRALVDRASIEVFCEDGTSIFVSGGLMKADGPALTFVAHSGAASIEQLSVHGLRSIWR